ncbi:MAG: ArsR/SmtB family transcription factor [Candidatus Hodarchaeota archaeon]
MQLLDKERKIISTLSKCDDIPDAGKYYKELRKLRNDFDKNQEKISMVEIFEALGNKDRFIILDALKERDRCVCELEAILDKAQGTVSRQLKILVDAGLIQGWSKGKFTHYSLKRKTLEEFNEKWEEWCRKISNWLHKV